jgi:hypothetical protein
MRRTANHVGLVTVVFFGALVLALGASVSTASAAGGCNIPIASSDGLPPGVQCQCGTGYSGGYDVYTCSGGGKNYSCTYSGGTNTWSCDALPSGPKREGAGERKASEGGSAGSTSGAGAGAGTGSVPGKKTPKVQH